MLSKQLAAVNAINWTALGKHREDFMVKRNKSNKKAMKFACLTLYRA